MKHLKNYLQNLKTNNYSESTLYNYKRDLKTFQDFLRKSKTKFEKINKETIQNYKVYLNSLFRKTAEKERGYKKLSSSSINRMLSSLRSYLKYLIDMAYPCPISPESIKLIKTEKKHYRPADFEEIKKLIESPTKLEKNKMVALRNRTMLEILFSTGMRISELINLKKNEIDKGGRIFIRGKGKKERFVYLTPRASDYLEKYLSKKKSKSFLVFNARNKEGLTPAYLQGKIKEYRETLGISTPLSAHSIRHGFATFLAEKGASPVAIQILLGHESLNTTTRYVHASDRYAQKIHSKYHPLKTIK